MIGYININGLGNKINYLREVFLNCPIDIKCIDETKIDPSFPDAQFHIDGYQFPPFHRSQNKNGGGKFLFVRECIIAKRTKKLGGKTSETIFI